jgi:hypothetical protein
MWFEGPAALFLISKYDCYKILKKSEFLGSRGKKSNLPHSVTSPRASPHIEVLVLTHPRNRYKKIMMPGE